MKCPLRRYCQTKCNEDIFKLIGINKNHVECKKFKNKNEFGKTINKL